MLRSASKRLQLALETLHQILEAADEELAAGVTQVGHPQGGA
jgi:hypothetical protein